MVGGVSRSKLGKCLFMLGKSLSGSLTGWKRKWSGLHLLETPEAGELGRLGDIVIFLADGRCRIVKQVKNFLAIIKAQIEIYRSENDLDQKSASMAGWMRWLSGSKPIKGRTLG